MAREENNHALSAEGTWRREVANRNSVLFQRMKLGLRIYREMKLGTLEGRTFPRTWDIQYGRELLQDNELTATACSSRSCITACRDVIEGIDLCARLGWSSGVPFIFKEWTFFQLTFYIKAQHLTYTYKIKSRLFWWAPALWVCSALTWLTLGTSLEFQGPGQSPSPRHNI